MKERRELTLVRRDEQDLETTRRSVGEDRALQTGTRKETSAGGVNTSSVWEAKSHPVRLERGLTQTDIE